MDGPRFSLLETMRLQDGRLARRDSHLARMAAAAAAQGFPWDPMRVAEALARMEAERRDGVWRIRLLVSAEGDPTVECGTFPPPAGRPWRVGFARRPVVDGPFLRMKTTARGVYDEARQSRPDLDDVLLWTADDDVTESSIANLVVEIDGRRCTPPATSPLLPGVFRGELLATGAILERQLSKHDVATSPRVWLVNSLREWIEVTVEP